MFPEKTAAFGPGTAAAGRGVGEGEPHARCWAGRFGGVGSNLKIWLPGQFKIDFFLRQTKGTWRPAVFRGCRGRLPPRARTKGQAPWPCWAQRVLRATVKGRRACPWEGQGGRCGREAWAALCPARLGTTKAGRVLAAPPRSEKAAPAQRTERTWPVRCFRRKNLRQRGR